MKKKIILITISLLLLLLSGCFVKKDKLQIKQIFTKKIGFQKDEIGTYLNKDMFEHIPFSLFYKSGFYYICDPVNNKIIKLTERGYSVLFIYNPQNNPGFRPTEATSDGASEKSTVFLNTYKEYPIVRPKMITVDNNKKIYVVNKEPNYKTTTDNGDIVDEKILKFDQDGNIISIIGENGQNSLPFGYISDIKCDNKNNLIVLEKQVDAYTIKKFNPAGEKIYSVNIKDSDIPLQKNEIGLITSITNIKLGYAENYMYITVQYIKQSKSKISTQQYEELYSKLLLFSMSKNAFVKLLLKINIRTVKLSKKDAFYANSTNNQKTLPLPVESFLGLDKNGEYIFSQKEIALDELIDNNQILYVYTTDGILTQKSTIRFPQGMIYASDLQVSSSGKIFSYYIKDGVISFVNVE